MIGIIGAMGVEVEGVRARIEHPEIRVVSGIQFTAGELCGRSVVVAQCGIGKVNAAVCAQTMILEYAPEIIVNSGVGGSLTHELTFGDIAIADKLVQHDVDTSALGDPVGMVSTVNKIYFECDARAVALLQNIVAGMKRIKGMVGTIASGDQFIGNNARKEWIVDTFHAIACEMEGGAIAQVCAISGVNCAVIRAISDNADDDSHMDYSQFLQIAAERSIEALVRFVADY